MINLFFKDVANNKVYCKGFSTSEEGSAYTPPTGHVQISEEEAREWSANSFNPKYEILSRLTEIDKLSSRPLRAIAAGVGTQVDQDTLLGLENEATSLRVQLATME